MKQDEEYEIFDEAASYENKSVEKSKIQHNSKPNNNKEKDDMDGYKKGNDSAVNVTKIDNLAKGDSDNTEIEKEKSRQYEKMKQENDAEDDANEWSERKVLQHIGESSLNIKLYLIWFNLNHFTKLAL